MRYALNFLAVLCAALLWTILFSPQVDAAPAKYEGGSLIYNDKPHQGPDEADRAAAERLGIPEGSKYYTYIDSTTDPKTASIIYFSPGDELGDANSAQRREYTYDDSGTEDKYTQRGGASAVEVDNASYESGGVKEETSCVVSGIGYIICPIMNFLADAMDKMYDVLKRFLEVKPLSTDRESGLYKAWAIMLSIANVLFIVGFLAIIYSYVTNQGVKQYDLRSVIPRLIIAAVLINVSYYICALAVDASNIIGASLQDVFNNIRKDVAGNSVTDNTSWSNAATFILSGGTIGAIAAGVAIGTFTTASLHLLTPVLIGAGIALLVAIIILAARQALITILIVVAPLAFAAFILPSTQKYFDKWKSLFMTMLLVYPMFALLFGGSQLAATLIAQNASSALVVIFAMFIQVAPLIITPFLIKFSGGLLGKLAGIVNNPAKGPADRVKNWSKGKLDMKKRENIANGNRGAALARRFAENKEHDENRKKKYETMSRRRYNESARGRQMAIDQALANDQLARADKLNESAYEELKRTDPNVRMQAVQLKIADMELNVNKAKMDTYLHELESKKGAEFYAAGGKQVERMLGKAAAGGDAIAQSSLAARMNSLSHESHTAASALQFAKEQDRLEFSEDMVKGSHANALQVAAAGIAGDKGTAQAAARAVQEMRADFGKSAGAMKEMMDHFKLSGSQVKDLANMRSDVAVSKDGVNFTFKADDDYTIDAAIESIFEKKGNYKDMREIVMKSGRPEYEPYLTTIVQGVATKMVGKAGFMGGRSIDTVTVGGVANQEQYYDVIRTAIAGGKFKQEFFATNDTDALRDVYAVMRNNMNTGGLDAQTAASFHANVQKLSSMAHATLKNENISGSLSQGSLEVLQKIEGLFGSVGS